MAGTQTQEAPVTVLLAPGEEITVTPDQEFDSTAFFEGWSMGTNARRELLGIVEKTDGQPVKVRIRPLRRWFLDATIIEEMGGIENATIPLAVWAAIAKTGRSFVGCVVVCGKPRVVSGHQGGGYRSVAANSVEDPYEWDDGRQFASLANS